MSAVAAQTVEDVPSGEITQFEGYLPNQQRTVFDAPRAEDPQLRRPFRHGKQPRTGHKHLLMQRIGYGSVPNRAGQHIDGRVARGTTRWA
jgi:hypothetical protein